MSEQIDIDISNLQFYSRLFREQQWQTQQLHWSVFEQTLREVADRIAQAKDRERKLTEFFREGMQGAFEGCDWCGADIQEKAVELGLARWEKYDPEKHYSLGSFEGDSGDDICIINDPLVAETTTEETHA